MNNEVLTHYIGPSQFLEEELPEIYSNLVDKPESFFTSFLFEDGKLPFPKNHYQRLKKSLEYKGVDSENSLSKINEFFLNLPSELRKGRFYIRITYVSKWNKFLISYKKFLETSDSTSALFLSQNARKAKSSPNFYKHPCYQDDIQDWREQNDLGDDIFWLDESKNITEAMYSNLIFFDGKNFSSPKSSRNVLEGTSVLGLSQSDELKHIMRFENISVTHALGCKNIFLINALWGVKKVKNIINSKEVLWKSHSSEGPFELLNKVWQDGFNIW